MAISQRLYHIVVRAAEARVAEGEDLAEVIESYNKLSDEQKELLEADVIEDAYQKILNESLHRIRHRENYLEVLDSYEDTLTEEEQERLKTDVFAAGLIE